MTVVHPATGRVADRELPAVAVLLGQAIPGPIGAMVADGGGSMVDCYPIQVTWWPGSSVSVRYRTTIEGGPMAGRQDLVGVAGRIPEGAVLFDSDGVRVGVWHVPNDPALPGLSAAVDDVRARRLLVDLGGDDGPVHTHLRAYRPGRRAVVSVDGPMDGIYLKVVRPDKVGRLHADHTTLSEGLPVPPTLGYWRHLGLMALQTMPGRTLRHVLEDPSAELPAPEAIAELLGSLPAPPPGRERPSVIERVPALADMMRRVVPHEAEAIDRFSRQLGVEEVDELGPVHGDFYEAQLLVDKGDVVGLLDVDTYGRGRRGDDPGVMLGHLALWQTMSSHPQRTGDFTRRLLRLWDRTYEHRDIRRRAAAALFTLASGPFRVQTAHWPGETADRIALAQRWLDSADRTR